MAVANRNGVAMKAGTGVAGVGVGAGSTLLVRRELDQSGETTVLRPSVMWGVGTGITALALPMLLGGGDGMVWELLTGYGAAAVTSGVFSAFSPKGGGVQVPTL